MTDLLVSLLRITSFVFIARALLSWFRIGADSPIRPVADVIHRITEPVLAPLRRVLPPMGGLDLSILIVIFGINLVLIPLVRSF